MNQLNLERIKEFRSLNNYKEINYEEVDNNECLILFSSNGLYYPNENRQLEQIIEDDIYEWVSLHPKRKFSKVIFFRNIKLP